MRRLYVQLFQIVLLISLARAAAATQPFTVQTADGVQTFNCERLLNSDLAQQTVEGAETVAQILRIVHDTGLLTSPQFSQALTAALSDYGVFMPQLKNKRSYNRFKKALAKTIARLNDDQTGARFSNFTMRILDHIQESAARQSSESSPNSSHDRKLASLVEILSARYNSGGQIKAPVARAFQDIAKQTLLALSDLTAGNMGIKNQYKLLSVFAGWHTR